MKHFVGTTAAVLLSAASYSYAADLSERDLCSEGSTDDAGNWYCQLVHAVTYTGIGHSGSYQQITDMSSSGSCQSANKAYSGALAPFDEEVSLHFRGPLTLKQLAVYTPSGASKKRDAAQEAHVHKHAHVHEREAAVGDIVTATINGQVVHWVNEYSGAATSAAAAAADVHENINYGWNPFTTTAPPAAAETQGNTNGAGSYGTSSTGSGWARQGYYNAANQTSNGLTFLNHNGGSGSGVFDYVFGNSLSYASTDGKSGASSPQILADTTLPSIAEVVVFTDKKCSGSDCGYVRPGTVAYHGFDGAEKVFLMEFGMPDDGQKASSIYSPVNMPAIWMLNAQIPRTLQYGTASCSCWTSGCGEFDIFEVLAAGDTRCKSTIHGNAQGGDSDYFARPVTGTSKAAVIMSNNQFHIKMLDDSTSFDPALSSSFINELVDQTATQNNLVSLFGLGK